MVSLQDIQASYGFKKIAWKVNGQLIDTEKGIKRVSLWTEEVMARWHMEWRDQLFEKTGCLTNRMIQTIHGDRLLLSETGWVTLHDEVTSLFSYRGYEKEMGEFFGKYYSCSISEHLVETTDHHLATSDEGLLKRPAYSKKKSFDPLIDALRKESLLRLSNAKRMVELSEKVKIPVVSPMRSLDQGKLIYGKLFWQHFNSTPERGYGSLRRILSEWLQRYGQSSFFSLLTELNKFFPIKKTHGYYLLAECITPWEFFEYMKQEKSVTEVEQLAMLKEKLTYQWETSRALVEALSKWLKVTQEKVSL